jgi:NTE family protein
MNQQVNGKPKIGLALSGGVVRGFAHLGVLEVLEAEGIEIDIVGGASAGALIGYCYAAGMRLPALIELTTQINWLRLAQPVWPKSGFVSFIKLEQWLVELLGDLHFADLARPFVVMTSDIDTGEAYAITSGRVAPAVRASCSVPGFVEPAELDGRRLVDGAVANNLPTKAVRHLGADYVIGVDILQHATNRRLGPLATGLAAMELMLQRSGSGLDHAECIITPQLQGQTYINFHQREQLMTFGREAAEASLPEIRAELAAMAQASLPQTVE